MTQIRLAPNNSIDPCPRCGNNTSFEAHSAQVTEDCCNVWVVCVCGYDPTSDDSGDRYEDVWGALNHTTIMWALDCWNSAIRDREAR
jgi:hypothetical protein